MKIIVTHDSPDMDAITSVWLIKKFLSGWDQAMLKFVPAGERFKNIKYQISNIKNPIEEMGEDEVIHVDTGLGPLDHHQTADEEISAASLTWDFIQDQRSKISEREKTRDQAVDRIVKVVVDIDHFKEVFWENPTADHLEFSLVSILDGLKLQKPDQNNYYTEFISEALDALLVEFENRIWAEEEIEKRGIEFETRNGRGMGFETVNDSVIKLAQKMGYVLVVRKDPRKGYVRIKARPESKVDLTLVFEKLSKMDPDATWFLHISKKMLLNGSVKNPKMRPTKLKLGDIIKVLEGL